MPPLRTSNLGLMKRQTVSRGLFAFSISATLGGCLSFDASHPLMIAPTTEDWHYAFSRLDPSAQETLAQGTGFIAASDPNLSGTIYNLRYGPTSKRDLF